MARRRRRRKSWWSRLLIGVAAVPVLYMLAALAGSLIAVNRGWTEPERGITVYLADNGVHSDIVMPVAAQGLDWASLLPATDFAAPPPGARWIAFGSGEENVYLNTPRWRDISPATIWSGLAGGKRVMHVEYATDPDFAVRQIRLRPEEYRRLFAAIHSDFGGRPQRLDHPGYGPNDAFYRGSGKASALRTCNSWTADKLRLAGVKTSAWPPFVQGVMWRYRKTGQST